jgi:hypothetical protein
MKLKTTLGTILKQAPQGLFAQNYELCGYATVQVKDADAEVVMVDGIDCSAHSAEAPLKMFLQHNYRPAVSEDYAKASMPVFATIGELVKTTKMVGGVAMPALAFGANYKRDKDGKLTRLAATVKEWYDDGTLDSFSAGYDSYQIDYANADRKSGYPVTKCRLREVSAVTLASNPHATMMKALKDACGEEFDAMAFLETRIAALSQQHKTEQQELLKALTQRFDEFEAAYVAKSAGGTQTGDAESPTPDELRKRRMQALKQLQETL